LKGLKSNDSLKPKLKKEGKIISIEKKKKKDLEQDKSPSNQVWIKKKMTCQCILPTQEELGTIQKGEKKSSFT